VGKPDGKKSLGRLGCKWKDNIQRELREIAGVVWMGFIGLGIETSSWLLCTQ
jgi:hypothetical protein